MMTRQPAVDLGVFLLVAVNTESHLKIHRLKTVFGLYIPVAFRAVQICPAYMRLMTEFYKIRYPENFYPTHGITGLVMFKLLYKLGVRRDYIFMTEEAFLHCRNTRLP